MKITNLLPFFREPLELAAECLTNVSLYADCAVVCVNDRYDKRTDVFPDAGFDVILIDGRARPACIKHSVSKVRIGGIILVDDPDRDYYFSQTRIYLEKFSRQDFFEVVPVNPQWSQTIAFLGQK